MTSAGASRIPIPTACCATCTRLAAEAPDPDEPSATRLQQRDRLIEQRLQQDRVSYWLRFGCAATSLAMFVAICITATVVLLQPERYNGVVLCGAVGALFTEAIALVAAVIKGVMMVQPGTLDDLLREGVETNP